MSEVRWSVDSLVSRDNALFGFGWIFSESAELTSVRLVLKSIEGRELGSILVEQGKCREDVSRAFSEHPNALNSGYLVLGAFPETPRSTDTITLESTFASGEIVERVIPPQSVLHFNTKHHSSHNQLIRHQWSLLFERGLRLIQKGDIASLIQKIKKYISARPTAALNRPSDLEKVLNSKERNDVCLIIDHSLGGGANHYRDRLVESVVEQGRTTMTLTFEPSTLSHLLVIQNTRVNHKFVISDEAFLLEAMKHLKLTEIVYNTAVSFTKPEKIPELILDLRLRSRARIKILVHDFFSVCPSHFLLNAEGSFCNIPDPSVCVKCLPKNPHGFTTLFSAGDILAWRSVWGALLVAADEIVAFSNNSAKLLMRAYPQILAGQISITPHQVKHLPAETVYIEKTHTLCIGVVGQIGYHKGSVFIQNLAREIKRRGSGHRIIVIGAIDVRCEPTVVSQTGLYSHEEMPAKIGESGANIMLFPSICPETFSYVAQELMDLKLPVASFNFGAPAERLASYPKGLVLSSMDPADVLDQLILFHKKIYLAN